MPSSSDSAGVERFLEGIVEAAIPATDAWTDDAHLDATVPNWRFTVDGADAIRATYATWFADPGRFEEIRRLPTPGGMVVEYLLSWEDAGVPHAAHHVHLLTLAADGRIAEDHVFCGGRWDAALLAEMGAAGA
jgi:hypothetical protein